MTSIFGYLFSLELLLLLLLLSMSHLLRGSGTLQPISQPRTTLPLLYP